MPRQQADPVVFGEPKTLRSPRNSTMALEKSKYARPKKNASQACLTKPNQWREISISDANLIAALEQFMHSTASLAKNEIIEKVIVGEPVAGKYPLSVAIKKKGELD